jgi:hypothetical protein
VFTSLSFLLLATVDVGTKPQIEVPHTIATDPLDDRARLQPIFVAIFTFMLVEIRCGKVRNVSFNQRQRAQLDSRRS